MQSPVQAIQNLGRGTVQWLSELGYLGTLFAESFYFLLLGPARGQPVRWRHILEQMRQIGADAVPIVALLSMVIGLSLAINGIAQLKTFGAESKIVMGIVIAGRTASALAARIGSMVVSQEVDALRVIGVEPVRYLAAPPLIAAIVMMPVLVVLSDFFAILGGGLFSMIPIDISLAGYFYQTLQVLEPWDIGQGLIKSVIFGILIVIIGVATGFGVTGGAEGVGRATTRAVVFSICAILIADMVFSFFLNR
jgi:phospholipid/cholesterol/gamma-HCH transport system permease protein